MIRIAQFPFHRTAAATFVLAAALLHAGPGKAQEGEVGSLECTSTGGWNAIIVSREAFACTFTPTDGGVPVAYNGVIDEYGVDLSATGDTALQWAVIAVDPSARDLISTGQQLGGTYTGVGADATVGVGVGANALIGGGSDSIALQPISVQSQTGLGVAAGVRRLTLSPAG